MSALDTMPKGLGPRHRSVAMLLLGRPEGVTRQQGARHLDMEDDRLFREVCSEIASSGWLPVIAPRDGRGPRMYRIAGPNEVELVSNASQEDHSRAVSLHKRSKGRLEAFRAHHTAGSLFVPDVAELEES